MWYNVGMDVRVKKGQALLEYVLALLALLVVVTVMVYLLRATRSSVTRTETLVSSEYP